jgi:hypothetical protein
MGLAGRVTSRGGTGQKWERCHSKAPSCNDDDGRSLLGVFPLVGSFLGYFVVKVQFCSQPESKTTKKELSEPYCLRNRRMKPPRAGMV